MSSFPDHFSRSAASYAAHRPTYPQSLYEWLANAVKGHERVWDCGTGNGQAAVALTSYYSEVVATDPSHAQLLNAVRHDRIRYAVMTAEAAALASQSVDLITVAQALHWFELPRFYQEARRILAPGGSLAVWTYNLISVTPEIDALIRAFYRVTLGGYWPKERALVEVGYSGLNFPFDEQKTPTFEMERNWTLQQFSGYLETWSAVSSYRDANGESPVGRFVAGLRQAWGEDDTARRVTWPIELRLGTV
ncbi:MAG: class I SAM-dependent methyltransferase [bacterium]